MRNNYSVSPRKGDGAPSMWMAKGPSVRGWYQWQKGLMIPSNRTQAGGWQRSSVRYQAPAFGVRPRAKIYALAAEVVVGSIDSGIVRGVLEEGGISNRAALRHRPASIGVSVGLGVAGQQVLEQDLTGRERNQPGQQQNHGQHG